MAINHFMLYLSCLQVLNLFILNHNFCYSFKFYHNDSSYNISGNRFNQFNRNKFTLNARFTPEQVVRYKRANEIFNRTKLALAYGDYKNGFDSFISELEKLPPEDFQMFPNLFQQMTSFMFLELDKFGECSLLDLLANKSINLGIKLTETAYSSIIGAYLRIGNLEKSVEWLDKLKADKDVLPKHRTYLKLFKELAFNEESEHKNLIWRLFDDIKRYGLLVSPELSAFALLALIKQWASQMSAIQNTLDRGKVVDESFNELENGVRTILEIWQNFKFSDNMLNLDTAIWINNIFKLIKPPTSSTYISNISKVEAGETCGKCACCPIVLTSNIIETDTRFNIFTKWLEDTLRYSYKEIPSLSTFYTRLYRAHVMGSPYRYILDGANIGLNMRSKLHSLSNIQVEAVRRILEQRGFKSLIIFPKSTQFPLVHLENKNKIHPNLDNPILSRLTANATLLNKNIKEWRRYNRHSRIQMDIFNEWRNMDVVHVCHDDCYDDNYMFLASIATLSTKEALFVDNILSNTLKIKPMETTGMTVREDDGSDAAFVVTQDMIRDFCISGVSEYNITRWREHSLIPYQLSAAIDPGDTITSKNLLGKDLLDLINSYYDEAEITTERRQNPNWPTNTKVFVGHSPKYSLRIVNDGNLWHFPISLERLHFNANSRYKSKMQFVTDTGRLTFHITTPMPENFIQKSTKRQITDWFCLNLNIFKDYRDQYKYLSKENPQLIQSHLEDLEMPDRVRTQPFPGKGWILTSKVGTFGNMKDQKLKSVTSPTL